MGNGINEIKTNTEDAFKYITRNNINNNMNIKVPMTSCRVKNMFSMIEEINNNNFEIIYNGIKTDLPCFNKCMMFLIKKRLTKI